MDVLSKDTLGNLGILLSDFGLDNGTRDGLDKFLRAASTDPETALHYEFMQDYKVHLKHFDGHIEEVFSTWMAFGGNARDLGSFGEETDEIKDLHQILEEVLLTAHGDSVAGITRRCRDPSGDGVRDFETTLGRSLLNKDLESST
ncbi:hypothetical protein Tco_1506973 [Tanacetum coccineum]